LIGYWIKDYFNSKDEKKSKKLKKQIDSEGLSGVEQGGRFVIDCLIVLFFNFILSLISYFTFDMIIQGIWLGLSLFIIQIVLIIVWVYKDYK
jgi:phosphoglycerol transferase MdoB-like AlkP superfamily enzyme